MLSYVETYVLTLLPISHAHSKNLFTIPARQKNNF